MLSKNLETVLNDTFRRAKSKKHEFMTVELLLLELLDDEETHEILLAVGADFEELKSGLDEYIESMHRHDAHRGKQAGVEYAEAFVQHRGSAYPRDDLLAEMFGNLPS